MKPQSHILAVALLLLLGTGGVLGAPGPVPAKSSPRIVDITAKRFAFAPDQITLKKGETVTLRLKTEDVSHGFFLHPLKIDEVIEPGKVTQVTVTPQTTGSFTTICDHFCGANHGNMKMTIVVE